MRVLICCERSGVVREAFRKRGHQAWSCDLVPADDGGPHIQSDACDAIASGEWDIIVMHPPCTYLCGSGLHWNKRRPEREKLTEGALMFVKNLMFAATESALVGWALENPVGLIGTRIRPADQWIQPYWFGDDASKRTGLWLHNLPILNATKCVPGRIVCGDCRRVIRFNDRDNVSYQDALRYGCESCGAPPSKQRMRWSNQTDSGQNRLGPSETRSTERSRTYPRIALAFAEQWGSIGHVRK